jgi:hypothetical protein
VRRFITALTLILALLVAAPLSLALGTPAPCATQHHECQEETAPVADCCVVDDAQPIRESTPAEQRVHGTDVAAVAVPSDGPMALQALPAPPAERPRPHSPRLSLLDLPTLFSTFLI